MGYNVSKIPFSFKIKDERKRRNFSFNGTWQGKVYNTKQLEVYTVKEKEGLIIITVIVKYF